MESLHHLYRIGSGPSSSHTMGPENASKRILKEFPEGNHFEVTLFGSLALTGRGHLTDKVVERVLGKDRTTIIFDPLSPVNHPNTMTVKVFHDQELLAMRTFVSVGGGEIIEDGKTEEDNRNVYPFKNFSEIRDYADKEEISLADVVYRFDNPDIKIFLKKVWETMEATIERGLKAEGTLPGGLKVKRKASLIYSCVLNESVSEKDMRMISAYAYAVAEENASGGTVVTAPTCGSAGVVPACLYYLKNIENYPDDLIIDALAVAGIIGDTVKTNASIAGAYAGCQSEIGTACSMAAGAVSFLKGKPIEEIESAAEIVMEHHLGLTCDPVDGLVQIPCIERNAIGALSAMDAVLVASLPIYPEKMSFDSVVETMFETGKDLNDAYRETAKGGLAKSNIRRN